MRTGGEQCGREVPARARLEACALRAESLCCGGHLVLGARVLFARGGRGRGLLGAGDEGGGGRGVRFGLGGVGAVDGGGGVEGMA